MRKRRCVVFSAMIVITLAIFIRVRYEKLGWGGYWYVDLIAPWQP